MKPLFLFVLMLAVLPLAACKSSQPTYLSKPEVVQAQGVYVHALSGMAFPETVGAFQRVLVLKYDAEGLDVSAGYNAPDGTAATVYVYPAPPLVSIGSPPDVIASARATLCKGEFERRKKEVAAYHSGASPVEEKEIPSGRGSSSAIGRMAAYEYEELFHGQRQRVHSELYVFCYVGDRWALQYRFTAFRDVGGEPASRFIDQLPWTIQAGER